MIIVLGIRNRDLPVSLHNFKNNKITFPGNPVRPARKNVKFVLPELWGVSPSGSVSKKLTKKGAIIMKTVLRETIVTIAVVLVFVLSGCSHTKKETAETVPPYEGIEKAEVNEGVVEDLPVEVIRNLSNIYFDFDKSVLSKGAIEELKGIGAWLLENPNTKIRIEGNCDERGTDEYNLALGERRAKSAKNFLVSLGVAPEKIITISFGEENPADPGHNEMAWAKNRRAEFNIVD